MSPSGYSEILAGTLLNKDRVEIEIVLDRNGQFVRISSHSQLTQNFDEEIRAGSPSMSEAHFQGRTLNPAACPHF